MVVLSTEKPWPETATLTLAVKSVPVTVIVLVTGVPTVVLMLNEVGLAVILGTEVAVPETETVLSVAPLLESVIVPVCVPDEVGL